MTITVAEQTIHSLTFKSLSIAKKKPIESSRLTKLQFECYQNLYQQMMKQPKVAIKPLKKLYLESQYHPKIANLLAYGYIRLKKIKKAEHLIELNFEKNSDCLMAKINYADQCLRKKLSSKIPQILNHHLDLSFHQPSRGYYYIDEVIGLICVIGFYYLQINQIENANAYLIYAQNLSFKDPAVELLARKISKKSSQKKGHDLLKKFIDNVRKYWQKRKLHKTVYKNHSNSLK